jgi:hypothetical protein
MASVNEAKYKQWVSLRFAESRAAGEPEVQHGPKFARRGARHAQRRSDKYCDSSATQSSAGAMNQSWKLAPVLQLTACGQRRGLTATTTATHQSSQQLASGSIAIQSRLAHWDHSMGEMLQVNSMAVFLRTWRGFRCLLPTQLYWQAV